MTAKYRIKQYQHLVESDDAVMNSCEEEIQKLESQIQDTGANLDAIMSADSDAQKGRDDYEVANAAWEEYRAASDEILKLSREGKQQEAAKLMTGEVYEEYKAFAEKLTILCDKFQVELDQATIIGLNGAGKSTLARCICGLEKKCGFLQLDGKTLDWKASYL